jgi:hypothetical protein
LILLLTEKKSYMRKYFPYILSAWIVISLSVSATQNASSQTNQNVSKSSTVRSETTITDGNSSYVKGITTGRAKSLIGAAAGVISLVTGWRTKACSNKGTGSGRTAAVVALSLGLIGIVVSILHLSTSAGAVFGSGSGKAGAIVALLLSLIGMTLSIMTLRQKKV